MAIIINQQFVLPVHDHSSASAGGQLGSGVVGTTQLAAASVTDANVANVFIGKNTVSAGSYLLASANTALTVSVTNPVLLHQFRVGLPGTYRVAFDLYTYNGSITIYGRIYKNGVAYGTLRSTTAVSNVTFTEDLSFNQNDTVDFYSWVSSSSSNGTIANCRLYSSTTILPAVLL